MDHERTYVRFSFLIRYLGFDFKTLFLLELTMVATDRYKKAFMVIKIPIKRLFMKVRQPFIIAILFAYTSAIFINLIQSAKSSCIKTPNYKVSNALKWLATYMYMDI